ncbi:MAG TPA: alpha/beta hydrolase [Kofleriaceae bacterium]|jgi:pimeloyl-ACP methyl ester carboxylesterase|nr:alpha/beta hydrolase [Kofleriaceae bacterium]
MPSFSYRGRQIGYHEHGSGPRTIVLTHGLLMDSRMYTKLAPTLAAQGHRVITVDMLGHGSSAQPHTMTEYSMPQFGRDVIALLDHLELAQAVVGGTSLGANVALEAAVAAPARVRALVLEMPVLENALPAAAAAFVPLALALRISQRLMTSVAALTRRIPRTHYLADIAIDFVRRDPAASLAVLDGLIFGRVAPSIEERNTLTQPTLVIGHPSDPIHPFSDADRIARELPHARLVTASSMFEWRIRPDRLDRELLDFLDEVWQPQRAVA